MLPCQTRHDQLYKTVQICYPVLETQPSIESTDITQSRKKVQPHNQWLCKILVVTVKCIKNCGPFLFKSVYSLKFLSFKDQFKITFFGGNFIVIFDKFA